MSEKIVKPLIEMDAESAIKAHHNAKAKGHKHGVGAGIVHPPRRRAKANGAHTAPIMLSKLTKGNVGDAVLHHLGINSLTDRATGRPSAYAVVCFTHGEAVLTRTRHQATHGAIATSGQDARTEWQKTKSKGCPVGWCKGCVSAMKASV